MLPAQKSRLTDEQRAHRIAACEGWARGNLSDAISFIAKGEYHHASACMQDAQANLDRATAYRAAP